MTLGAEGDCSHYLSCLQWEALPTGGQWQCLGSAHSLAVLLSQSLAPCPFILNGSSAVPQVADEQRSCPGAQCLGSLEID